LDILESQNIRRESVFECVGETKGHRVHKKEVKVEAFNMWEFSQVWEESACPKREHNCHQIRLKGRSGPLKFPHPGRNRRAHKAGEIVSH
jgi:hypothetical protein